MPPDDGLTASWCRSTSSDDGLVLATLEEGGKAREFSGMVAGSGCKVSATADWLAVGAVWCEPVSAREIPYGWENTGKSYRRLRASASPAPALEWPSSLPLA